MRIDRVPLDSVVIFKTDYTRTEYTFLRTDGDFATVRSDDARLKCAPCDAEVEVVG